MPTIFHKVRNRLSATVAAVRAPGAPITVTDGSPFGTAFPIFVTVLRAGAKLCNLDLSGRAANVIAVTGAVDGTTDVALAANDVLECRPIEANWDEVTAAVNALEVAHPLGAPGQFRVNGSSAVTSTGVLVQSGSNIIFTQAFDGSLIKLVTHSSYPPTSDPILEVLTTDGVETFGVNERGAIFGSSLSIQPTLATDIPLYVVPRAGQSAPLALMDFEPDGVTPAFGVYAAGIIIANTLTLRVAAEPADGTLLPSQCTTWLDPTPGAATYNVKAKNSAGTVVRGSIPLT